MTAPFKSYDVRGRIGADLTETFMEQLGASIVRVLGAKSLITGHDARDSSPVLEAALHRGMVAAGAEVSSLGLCCTEEVYFATDHTAADGGVMVTASHNPIDWNGAKLVGPGARPLTDAEFAAIQAGMADVEVAPVTVPTLDLREAFAAHVCSFVEPAALAPLTVLVDSGHGAAGPTFDAIAAHLSQLNLIRLHHAPDSSFPAGIPNPLIPENRAATLAAMAAQPVDLAIAWDGDGDRCFFYDDTGAFLPGELVVALLAKATLAGNPGAGIVHDARVVKAVRDTVEAAGGTPIISRTGHAHLKAKMRAEGAVYGGEMSAHHYFRDFMCCDSGMIPALLMLDLLSRDRRPLSEQVADLRQGYPSSGEINFRHPDPKGVIADVQAQFPEGKADHLDGLTMDFGDWRFSLRASSTEPLLRLNVEARGDEALLADKTAQLRDLIGGEPV